MGGCGSQEGKVMRPRTKAPKGYKKAEELQEFKFLFLGKTNSSLYRNLTEPIWEEYKDKCDEHGVSFKTCIFSGIKNLDSGIGLYAGSHDSYKCFNKLFDKVILEYHKHPIDAKHISDMNADLLVNADFSPEDAAMIKSTRIRVGRNLKGYPLGPGVTKEQRMDIMNKVVEACNKFEGDLKGTFYPLEGMDKKTQDQLIADHFLFKEGDRFLEACNLNRDWPSGRGIFHNNEKTFLVWVNEEDQLRIISMQPGADIKEVFSRLSRAAAAIEKIAEFSFDQHLGYITSCPTNLGTALRASVHIKLPRLAKNMKKFQEIADKYYVQIRGIHGEHSESSDGTYDISNKRRLGRSERELVQDMIDGVKSLIAAEKEEPPIQVEKKKEVVEEKKEEPKREEPPQETPKEEPAQVSEPEPKQEEAPVQAPVEQQKELDPYFDLIMNEDLAKNQWPAALEEHKKSDGHQSLMAKTVTQEMFEKLKDVKSKNGWTLARAINTGVCYPTSFMGCHAGDKESYEVFGDLFKPVIEAYHSGYKLDGSMQHVTDMSNDKITEDLSDAAKGKVISTRIRCARNLCFFPLNPGGTKENRLEIADLMEKVFATLEGDLAGTFYRHSNMTPEQQQDLIDKHYLFRGKDKMQAASGYHQFWPLGRGIFVSDDEKFLLWVNEGDHLRIISMEKGSDVKSVFGRLERGVAAIEAGLKEITGRDEVFMSDPIMGMITCCPTNLGTCMRGSVHILVPKLIAKIGFKKIDEMAREMNCQARGSTGEHSEVIDRIDISNWRRLGFPEFQLIQDMIKFANKLSAMEDEDE